MTNNQQSGGQAAISTSVSSLAIPIRASRVYRCEHSMHIGLPSPSTGEYGPARICTQHRPQGSQPVGHDGIDSLTNVR